VSAQLLKAFQDSVGTSHTYALFKLGVLYPMQEFSADVKHRMRTRKDAEWWTPTRITYSPFTPQLATRHLWFTFPFSSNELLLPRYLHLDLSKRVMRNVSRLRLHVHALEVEAAAWLARGFCVFNQCPGGHVQNEVQAFLSCRL
jgi:hypothetical protein